MYFCFSLFVILHYAKGGGRIIGGELVPITEYPHQAALLRRQFVYNTFQCGGVIISSKHILTAAHCKRGPIEEYSVVTGETAIPSTDIDELLKDKTYKLKSFVVHPDFDPKTAPMYDHDIAVLTVEGTLKLNEISAKPIELATEIIPPGTITEVSGYGNTERYVVPRPRSAQEMRPLKAAYVPTVAHPSCVKYFKEHHPNYHVTENMICAGRPCQDDACQVVFEKLLIRGDSGGPLISEGKLVGLVSYGKGCGSYDPGVYTNVYLYKNFICKETGGLVGKQTYLWWWC